MKYIHSLFISVTIALVSACNNNGKEPTTKEDTVTPAAQKNYTGSGLLKLDLTVDEVNMRTDSASYSINEYGGMEIKGWGERFTQGASAYSYTLDIRFGAFHGKGEYAIEKEQNSIYWQDKSYYVESGKPGSVSISESDDTSGQFEVAMTDGNGTTKKLKGIFRKL